MFQSYTHKKLFKILAILMMFSSPLAVASSDPYWDDLEGFTLDRSVAQPSPSSLSTSPSPSPTPSSPLSMRMTPDYFSSDKNKPKSFLVCEDGAQDCFAAEKRFDEDSIFWISNYLGEVAQVFAQGDESKAELMQDRLWEAIEKLSYNDLIYEAAYYFDAQVRIRLSNILNEKKLKANPKNHLFIKHIVATSVRDFIFEQLKTDGVDMQMFTLLAKEAKSLVR